jgi:putative Mg2+ transporter-C (MgtC) family protein
VRSEDQAAGRPGSQNGIRAAWRVLCLGSEKRELPKPVVMETGEIVVRLVAAMSAGALIGLNRDLHGKPTGVRTLGVVGLSSALVVMASDGFASPAHTDWSAASRVIQGLVTGIGFLGAGVIVRTNAEPAHIHGLTTAACIWLTACVGIVCAVGAWVPLLIGLTLAFLLLIAGGPVEKRLHRWLSRFGQD